MYRTAKVMVTSLTLGRNMSYSQTFDALRNAPTLTKTQSYVLAQIATFTNAAGKSFPSVETLAAACKMTTRSLQRHMAALVNLGFLERIYRRGRSAFTRIRLGVLGAGRPTPDTTVYKPPTVVSPTPDSSVTHNLSLESEYQITAQPAAPVLAESPASAAIVVFESIDTEVPDTAPLANLPVIDVELVAHLPVVELVANEPVVVVDVPAAVITVDLVADTAPAIAPVVELVPAVQMPDAPVVATDTAPAMPEPAIAPAPAVTVPVELVPAAPAPTTKPNDHPFAEVPPKLLADYANTREAKDKSRTVSETEAAVFANEAAKAGLTIIAMIRLCIWRGWGRFEARFATPSVMAAWAAVDPEQAPATPATPVKRVNQTESAPPASPEIVEAERAKIAALRTKIVGTDDPLAWAKQRIADYEAGKHVSGFALRAARAALRL